ncbi:MAG: P-loop NTPase [Deltaproteobacteria bacterium]|nr:P-loop NTPase [Deltaproteobacteria bacterium]
MKRYRDVEGDGGSGIVGQVTEKLGLLNERMAKVRRKVAVMSGKGGVGKSTVTVGLASALAARGLRVGILDADLNGPSIPDMMGIDAAVEHGPGGAIPAEAFSIKAMSMDLFLASPERHVRWDGPSETSPWVSTFEATALRELLADTAWGELDMLLIDLPPGHTRFNDLSGLLPGLDGVVMVTTPSEVSNLIVLKSINKVKESGVPVAGILENMMGYTCVHCGGKNELFAGEDMREAFEYAGVPCLGRVTFDRALSDLKGYLAGGKCVARGIFDEIGGKVLDFVETSKEKRGKGE